MAATGPSAVPTDSELATLQAEMKQLRVDLAKISETIGSIAKQSATGAINQAQAKFDSAVEQAKGRANDVAEAIQEKPLSSAVTAFGIGIVLGMLWSKR